MASLAPLLNQLSEAFPIPVGDDDRSDSGTLDALRLCLKQILSLILDLTLNEKEPDSPLNVVKKTVSKAQKQFQEALLQRIKNGKRYAVKIYLTSLQTSTNLSLCSGAFDKLLMSLPDSKSWAVLARYWCYEDFRVAVLRSVTEEIVQPSTSSSNYSSDILLLIKQNANDPDPEQLFFKPPAAPTAVQTSAALSKAFLSISSCLPPRHYLLFLKQLQLHLPDLNTPIKYAPTLERLSLPPLGEHVRVVALQNLFYLTSKHSFNPTNFYASLLDLSTKTVFSKPSVLMIFTPLLKLALNSTHVGLQIKCDFVVQLLDCASHSTVSGAGMALGFVENLLKDEAVLQKVEKECGALKTLEKHWFHAVRKWAKEAGKVGEKRKRDLTERMKRVDYDGDKAVRDVKAEQPQAWEF
ncbi:hypothetical protein TrST_g2393 [Triparma strigata]|uniref:Uncharacterized protein n=1 Tax=Triparma strigata TaxID=1606541 RepID=A0A9W7ANI4_9STRA|nr:hypothetical protein TrST_g2393 [Triparma strigata]